MEICMAIDAGLALFIFPAANSHVGRGSLEDVTNFVNLHDALETVRALENAATLKNTSS